MKNFVIAIILLFISTQVSLAQDKPNEDKKLENKKNTPLSVVVSIKPIHSMVAAVMGEIGAPSLIIDGTMSEHDYTLKPSDMKKIEASDVVFFTSLDIETFFVNVIPSLKKNAVAVELASSDGVKRQEPLGSDIGDNSHGHNHASYDPHIWLSPENAIAMVKQIKKILALKDPKNRGIYEVNAKNYIAKIASASDKITLQLSPYKNIPFVVFHDAYGYYVKHYGLNQVASVSQNPELPLNAEKIKEINDVIKVRHAYCVFSDPAFNDDAVRKILNKSINVKIVQLDPLGINIEKGEGAYIALMNKITSNVLSCIGNGN